MEACKSSILLCFRDKLLSRLPSFVFINSLWIDFKVCKSSSTTVSLDSEEHSSLPCDIVVLLSAKPIRSKRKFIVSSMLTASVKRALISCEPVPLRISTGKFQFTIKNISIVQCYALKRQWRRKLSMSTTLLVHVTRKHGPEDRGVCGFLQLPPPRICPSTEPPIVKSTTMRSLAGLGVIFWMCNLRGRLHLPWARPSLDSHLTTPSASTYRNIVLYIDPLNSHCSFGTQ